MNDSNQYQWHKDDFEKGTIHRDPTPSNLSQTYYTENYTKKKKKALPLNYITVALISAIVGGLVFGTTFAFLTPIINQQPSVNPPQAAIMGNEQEGLKTPQDPLIPDKEMAGQDTDMSNDVNGNETAGIMPMPIINNPSAQTLSVKEIHKKVGPSIVGVVSKVQATGFWGSEGGGSGIIISPDGYIVTNNHVIEGGTEIKVILNGDVKNEFKAKVIGADAKTDLAVLKIDPGDMSLPYAQLGNSSILEVGEKVVAIGNPLGQEFAGSVTVGYVSALNRTIRVEGKELTLIQTDAAINPGNSGGALINPYGEIIGINTVKIAVRNVEGMGFSIPIDEAKPVIEDLKKYGYVKGRPLIGIGGRNITENISEAYRWPMGVYVIQVSPFSGAERAGIQPGDIITKFNGERIRTMSELNALKEKLKVGDTVEIEVYREGKAKKFKVALTEERAN